VGYVFLADKSIHPRRFGGKSEGSPLDMAHDEDTAYIDIVTNKGELCEGIWSNRHFVHHKHVYTSNTGNIYISSRKHLHILSLRLLAGSRLLLSCAILCASAGPAQVDDASSYQHVFDQVEQLAFCKYNARPHWGKNSNR